MAMPSLRKNPSGSVDCNSRTRLSSETSKFVGTIAADSRLKQFTTDREDAIEKLRPAQVRVIHVGRDRPLESTTKFSSSPDDDDCSGENKDARRRTYTRKHRRCWDTSTTALQQDSGSESAPLLSSASQTSNGSVMFPNSETSDLDDSPVGGSSRYGSVGAASFNSIVTVLSRRLPATLMNDDSTITSNTENPKSVVQFVQHKCYEIQNVDLPVSNDKYEESDSQSKEIGKPYEIINLEITREMVTNLRCDDENSKQSSLVTIFSIWNTVLGSSMLTMPWGILMAGLVPGLFMLLAMSGLCLYTSYRLLKVHKYHGGGGGIEVPELCRIYLGPFADHVARVFSVTVLLGATIAYWILMSNFLYNSVNFFYDNISGIPSPAQINNKTQLPEVLCPKRDIMNYSGATIPGDRSYDDLGPTWDLHRTVPLFLAVVIFPLLNFNTTTFFTKFNSLGTVAIVYLVGFVMTKSVSWGMNMSSAAWESSWKIQSTFPALTGLLAMSFFIHNIIITIMQHNRDQTKNGRDLTIAYGLVTITYVAVGATFFVSFPLEKYCIEDNFLNNFQKWDVLTVGARMVLFFQLLTVFPLINYMLRIRLLSAVSPLANGSRLNVVIVNIFVVSVCIFFARFMPYIGTVIRYTGAMSGMIYVFTLPSLFHLAILTKKGEASVRSTILHLSIPVIGAANLVGQFFVTSH